MWFERHVNWFQVQSKMITDLFFFFSQIMEHINNFSRQRGRVIEFRELLYGYMRVNSLYGQDLILDLLLVYKKYRGKKMTVPVRRHLYIQRSFTDVRVREITGGVIPAHAVTLDRRFPGGTTRAWHNSTGLGRHSPFHNH